MPFRRILRLTRKRVVLLVIFHFGLAVIFGRSYFGRKTEKLSAGKLVNAQDEMLVVPIDSRSLMLPSNATSKEAKGRNASETQTQAAAANNSADVQLQEKLTEEQQEEAFLVRMAARQKQRHNLIRQKCRDVYNITELVDFKKDRKKILSWKKLYEHAYANDDFKFIICRVLKVGSFSWRKVIRSLHTKGSNAFRLKQKMGDYPMMNYNNETFLSELENYTKILFVREPFARLLSGYRDKYVELRHFPYFKPIGSKIIQAFRKGANRAQIASGKPTFEEFVRWLVQDPESRGGDYHWRPLFHWYHPCEMQYDYIGKLETAAEDAKYIFKMIGIDKLETYPSTETHHTFSSARDVLKKYYSQISPELIPKIVYRYREEFVLFNYSVPQTLSDIWS